jgi:hypothetical protein
MLAWCWAVAVAEVGREPDPVPGRQLVTREPGKGCGGDRDQVRHVMQLAVPLGSSVLTFTRPAVLGRY